MEKDEAGVQQGIGPDVEHAHKATEGAEAMGAPSEPSGEEQARDESGPVTDSKAKDKIMSYVSVAIEKNKSKLLPLLKDKGGEALKSDANIEKLAKVIYAFLPGVVRFALKEQVFVQFMLDNRSKLLGKLLEEESGAVQP